MYKAFLVSARSVANARRRRGDASPRSPALPGGSGWCEEVPIVTWRRPSPPKVLSVSVFCKPPPLRPVAYWIAFRGRQNGPMVADCIVLLSDNRCVSIIMRERKIVWRGWRLRGARTFAAMLSKCAAVFTAVSTVFLLKVKGEMLEVGV